MENNLLDSLAKDRKVRRAVARQSHHAFSLVYLHHHFKESPAPFHGTLYGLTESAELFGVVVAFRGSAKTTIMALSFPIWAIVGKQQRKFVLIVSQTQAQARQILSNIKAELEGNSLLRRDLGPFEEPDDEWKAQSLVLPQYGARITAVSVDSSVRGIKHREHRPDLIVFDDVEDLQATRSLEQRDKTYQWVLSDAIAAGTPGITKVVVIGNLLHEDSLVMRFRREIEEGKREGSFHAFPIADEEGNSAWPALFPSGKGIEALRKQVGNHVVFEREYMLRILPNFEQVIHREWIRRYDRLPDSVYATGQLIGIDLAASEKEKADCTAMLSGIEYREGGNSKLYVLPNPINDRLSAPRSLEIAKQLGESAEHRVTYYVEDVAYQRSFQQYLTEDGYMAVPVPVQGMDKRQRLALAAPLMQSGQILFPSNGADELVRQLVGFGRERYDDLADAFSILVNGYLQHRRKGEATSVRFVKMTGLYGRDPKKKPWDDW